ncbi:MAG: sugar kinase [Chloroflexota bacterium]|nr:sugar kinase [Chloroflexota bacterium]
MHEVITIGEAIVEIMRPSAGQPLDTEGEFRGPFASGAPAIFSVASARLGLSTAFVGAIGEDAFGRFLCERFTAEDVDISSLQLISGYATGVAVVAYDDSGGREFVFHIRHAASGQLSETLIPAELLDCARWLHLSGSTIFLNENSRSACRRALDLMLSKGGKISLDPNLRPELMPVDKAAAELAPFLPVADLLLPTESEAYALTGESEITRAVSALGTKPDAIIAVKRGPAGSTVFHNGRQVEIPGFAVDEVDPTGAGDCFSAAFIAGLEAGWAIERLARFANAAGALAVTKLGPMEGAPTQHQVEKFLTGNSTAHGKS